jgi:hypothetical protein
MADLIKYYLTDEGTIPTYVILNKGSSNGQYVNPEDGALLGAGNGIGYDSNVLVFNSKVDVINYMQTYMTGQTYPVQSNGEWTEVPVDVVDQAESFWFRVKEVQP